MGFTVIWRRVLLINCRLRLCSFHGNSSSSSQVCRLVPPSNSSVVSDKVIEQRLLHRGTLHQSGNVRQKDFSTRAALKSSWATRPWAMQRLNTQQGELEANRSSGRSTTVIERSIENGYMIQTRANSWEVFRPYPQVVYHDEATFLRSSKLHISSRCLEGSSGKAAEDTATNFTETKSQESYDDNHDGPSQELRTIRGSPVSWLSLGLVVATGAGLIYHFDNEKKKRIQAIQQQSRPGPGVGKAAIGGPFQLITHEGKEVTEKDFKGNWSLLYFGFTHCPDICPEELQKMVEAIDMIERKKGVRITPIFVSVDPERDNIEQLREYVKEFHPRLIGLTGSPENVDNVARQFRVYYMKGEEEGADYLVDHSIVMYLMDPQMEFVKFFGKSYDLNGLISGIIDTIKEYKMA